MKRLEYSHFHFSYSENATNNHAIPESSEVTDMQWVKQEKTYTNKDEEANKKKKGKRIDYINKRQ